MSDSRFLFSAIGAFAAIAGVFATVIANDTPIKAITEEQREAYKAEERQREARKTQLKREAAASRALQKALCEAVNVCKKTEQFTKIALLQAISRTVSRSK